MSQNESGTNVFKNFFSTILVCVRTGFCYENSRTIMSHRKHYGPVRVQKMLWPEKTGVCHAIIVHPPAGIAGGDHLTFQIETKDQAHAVVTTPGAGKWYKTNGKQAFQHIHFIKRSVYFGVGSARNHAV
jgi:urease accessory protein UreH